MANNYTQFAGIFTHLTADEERWLRHALRDAVESITDEQGNYTENKIKELCAAEPWRNEDSRNIAPNFQFEFSGDKENGRYLYFYAEASGSAWAAGQLAHAFFKQFRPTAIWSTNWAVTHDKIRGDSYGGAVVATAKEVRQMDSYLWSERMEEHFERTGELPPLRKVKRYKTGRFAGMGERAIADETGWNADTLRQLMHDFIDESGLTERYAEYLAHRANKEEKEQSKIR